MRGLAHRYAKVMHRQHVFPMHRDLRAFVILQCTLLPSAIDDHEVASSLNRNGAATEKRRRSDHPIRLHVVLVEAQMPQRRWILLACNARSGSDHRIK